MYQARRKAERLFLRLRNNTLPHRKEETIAVNYVQRFPPGHCIVAVTIPISHEKLRMVLEVGMANRGYHYPPAIINSRHSRCLRLMYRFRGIKPGETGRTLKYAGMIAQWAEGLFEMKAIVSPMKGLINARWRLRAF